MGFIRHIPTLKGDNYGEWIKKVDLAFVCGEVDEMITTPKPTEPPAPVRGDLTLMLSGRKRKGTMLL